MTNCPGKKPSAFAKRVKRRVSAKEHPFFAVCPPGLAGLALDEIHQMGILPDKTAAVQGGIEVTGKPDTAILLNLHSGSISRVTMRIAGFKATTFQQFEARMAAIDWALFLPQPSIPSVRAVCKKSALYHSDAIAERSHRIIDRHLQQQNTAAINPPHPVEQMILIRAEHDRFQVSVDTSGDLLFKRGIKTAVTPAPLRETLAFAMLKWAGFSSGDMLIDPMCGSGTFSIEGAMISQGIPPGFFRSFAFESLPGFSSSTFSWMKQQAQKQFDLVNAPMIFSSDSDDRALRALSFNSTHPLLRPVIQIEKQNFFDMPPLSGANKKTGVIMLNPPYGKRLGRKKDTRSLYNEIGRKLKSDFKSLRVGILLPDRQTYRDLGLKLNLHPIFHGGLDAFAGIGTV